MRVLADQVTGDPCVHSDSIWVDSGRSHSNGEGAKPYQEQRNSKAGCLSCQGSAVWTRCGVGLSMGAWNLPRQARADVV